MTNVKKKAYKIDLEIKGQHRIWIMDVHDTTSYGDTPHVPNMVSLCKTKKKCYRPDSKTCQKPYEFDLEVNVQGRIWRHIVLW